jgi:hypothetical protein
MSQLAEVSNRDDLKGNPWVCDCTFYTVLSLCSSHGVHLEIVCSNPQKCNGESWIECYKAGCDDGYTGVDQVKVRVTIGYTAVPSVGLENRGNKNVSGSEETTLNFGRNDTGYTRQPTEGLENRGQQKESDSFGIQMFIVYICISRTLTVFIVCPIALVILWYRSKTRRLRDADRDESDLETGNLPQNTDC